MFTVGLTGGSGTGKGVVSSIFEELGLSVFNCDDIYHNLISSNGSLKKKLIKAFGKKIRQENGEIDRKALAKIVFSDSSERQKLNQITHPYIIESVNDLINSAEKSGHTVCIIDAPLLYESGLDKRCDMIIGIIAPIETRIKRVVARDKILEDQAKVRILSQIQNDEITKRVSVILFNNWDNTRWLAENVKSLFPLINKKKIEKEKAETV